MRTDYDASYALAEAVLSAEGYEHSKRVAGLLPRDSNYGQHSVALLHDVLEDSNVTAAHLTALGFSDEVVADVVALTRQAGDTYAEYIQKVRRHGGTAVLVKTADLLDHLGQTATLKDSLTVRYERALTTLRV